MKKKIDVTFEVKTTIEVDVPEGYETTDAFVVSNKEEIAKAAKEKLFNDGIEHFFGWDNLYWNTGEPIEIDMTDIGFQL